MTPRLKSTRAARDLIKAHEPFLATAERRGKRWVVGYGHTAAAKEGVTLKPEDAELLLIYDVMRAEQTLDACVGAEMAAPMRDALVSFALSVGLRAFKVSDVARLARDGRHREAAAAIETWVRADQDGRLVVSDRLTARRAAEKALYLSGLEDSAAVILAPAAPAPVQAVEAPVESAGQADEASPDAVEPAVMAEAAPEAIETPEAAPERVVEPEAAPEPESVLAAEADEAGEPALVELDIAFEFPDEDADSLAIPDVTHAEIAADDAAIEAEDAIEAYADSEADTSEQDETPVEDAETDFEAEAEASEDDSAPVETEPSADAAPVLDPQDAQEPVEDAVQAREVKAAQDAAIAAVMARMARQVSASMTTGDEPEVAAGDASVKLGYSFLSTSHVELRRTPAPSATQSPAPETPTVAPRPQPSSGASLFTSSMVPLSPMGGSLQVSSIKVTPIAPQALPQGASDAPRSEERAAPLADREDSLTVKASQVAETQDDEASVASAQTAGLQLFAAPPHPALAPASAPGLSGDMEGPDHPDKDRDDPHTDTHHVHEEDEALDPAVVSGIEASLLEDAETGQRRGGDVMFISSLALGGLMVGLGGWDIAANMDAYMDLGLAYSPLGPTVFGAGVLLSAASAWFLIGRRNEK